MKKFLVLLLVFILIFCSLTACKSNEGHINETNSKPSQTLPFEDVKDNGDVEFEKEYTIDEILKIKTNWNKEYVFLKDIDNVVVEKKDDKNIKMSLTTNTHTFKEATEFYQKYTENKENKNYTKTPESYFVSFIEEYVSRTILVVENKDNIYIEINYSLDDVNKR